MSFKLAKGENTALENADIGKSNIEITVTLTIIIE